MKIIMSIHPNRKNRSKNPAITSVKSSRYFLWYIMLEPFIAIPSDMCRTPKITESFILIEFVKVSMLVFAIPHAMSKPNG